MKKNPHNPKEAAYFGASVGIIGITVMVIGCIAYVLYNLLIH